MYRNILIATDGSRLALRGIREGVKLAAAVGAKVTGVYVIAPYVEPMYGEGAIYVPALSPSRYKKTSEQQARKALAPLEIECETAKVECATQHIVDAQPWQGILRAARAKKCDAIVMTSHGRGGLGGLLLGSETTRVLAHSKIPVLVVR